MTIERFHLPNGEIVDSQRLLEEQLIEIAQRNPDALTTLPTGEYDVTPGVWTNNRYNHQLVVSDDGDAIYRMLPKNSSVGTFSFRDRSAVRAGGTTTHMPAEASVVTVAGTTGDYPEIRVFEIIYWRPGLSPRG